MVTFQYFSYFLSVVSEARFTFVFSFVGLIGYDTGDTFFYCKSTNFGVLLYLANCVFSLIFVAPTYVIVR